MPSSKNPNDIPIGAGKVPANTVTASSQVSPAVSGGGVDPSLNTYRPVVSGVIDDTTYPQYVGTGASTLDLTSGVVWLGDSVSDLPEELVALVAPSGITDSFLDLEPILADNGSPLKTSGITRIADSANLVGTGFVDASVTPIRVTFSGALAVGLAYRLVYAKPSTLRDTSDLQKANPLRSLAQLGYVTQLTARNAVSSGLNDRYRRSTDTIDSSTVDLNTPGSGAEITRDGQALTVISPNYSYSQTYPAGPYPDPFLAEYVAKYDQTQTPASAYDSSYSGNIGFLNIYPSRSYGNGATDAAEPLAKGGFFASSVSAFPVNITSDTNGQGDVITRMANRSPATLLADYVELAAPNYVARDLGSGYRSAVCVDVDMALVEFANGETRVFLISGVDAANNRLSLTTLGGSSISYTSTAVFVTWYQVTSKFGGSSTTYMSRPRPSNEGVTGLQPIIDLVTPDETLSVNSPVMRIGQFLPSTTGVSWNLSLFGSGGGSGSYGTWSHVTKDRIDRASFSAATSSILVDPSGSDPLTTHGNHLSYSITTPSGTHTMSVTSAPSATCEGVTVNIFVYNSNGVNVVMSWDSGFIFTEASDAQFGASNGLPAHVTAHWRATCVYLGGVYRYLVERVGDYLIA